MRRLLILATAYILLPVALVEAAGSRCLDSELQKEYYWVTGEREELPDWLFAPQDGEHIFAISDPLMSDEAGLKQAVSRAWMLSLLQQQVTIEVMQELYSTLEMMDGSQIDYLTNRLLKVLRYTPQPAQRYFHLERAWVSMYGETYLLLSEVDDPADATYTFSSNGTILGEYVESLIERTSVTKYSRATLNISSYEVNAGDYLSTSYELNHRKGYTSVESLFNNEELLNREMGRYFYADHTTQLPNRVSKSQVVTEEVEVEHGIWAALQESLSMAMINHNYPYLVKRMGEAYTHDDTQQIIRSIYKGDCRVSLLNLSLEENKLTARWHFQFLAE